MIKKYTSRALQFITRAKVALLTLSTLTVALTGIAASATTPNVLGAVFSSTGGTTTFTNCTGINPGPGVFGATTFTVTRQDGANVGVRETGINFVAVFNGTLDGTSFSGDSAVVGTSITGSFSGGTLDVAMGSLQLVNQTPNSDVGGGDTCTRIATVNATLISGPVAAGSIVDIARLTSTELTRVQNLSSDVRGLFNALAGRTTTVLRGSNSGFRASAGGIEMHKQLGVSAGELGLGSLGVWTSIGTTLFDNDFGATQSDGDRHNLLVGMDIQPAKNMVLGAAIGFERSEITTRFNNGEAQTIGATISPYFGWQMSDTWSMDASAGYSRLDTDQFRTDPTLGTNVTSNPDSDRWFAQANLNGTVYRGNWIITGRGGVAIAHDNQSTFRESDGTQVAESRVKLGTFTLGAEAAYQWHRGMWTVEPYAGLNYQYDYQLQEIRLAAGAQPDNDRDDFLATLGLRLFATDGLSAGASWSRRFSRTDVDENAFQLTVRGEF